MALSLRTHKCLFSLLLFSPLLLFFTNPLHPAGTLTGSTGQFFNVTSRSETAVILEWTSPPLEWDYVLIGGSKYALPKMATLTLSQQEGMPQLPQDVFILPMAASQTFSITVLDSTASTETAPTVCPAPVYQPFNDSAQLSYKPDSLFYSRNAFYPDRFVHAEKGLADGKALLRVCVTPMQYNPATHELLLCRFIRLQIRLSNTGPLFKPKDGHVQGTRDWYDPSREYVKMYVGRDGVYDVRGRHLSDLGVNINSLDPRTLKIFLNGVQQTCQVSDEGDNHFDDQDRIVFWGQERRGDSSYYSSISDTNVYWLTWGGDNGLRYPDETPGNSTQEPTSVFSAQLHLEEDLDYHEGDNNSDIQETGHVPGEGWVWYFVNRGEKKQIPFTLPGFSPMQDSVHVKIRLRGTTLDVKPLDHHARISINSKTVKDVYFDNREEKIVSASVAAQDVHEFNNTIEIYSVDDMGVERSQFYLDWIEFYYSRYTTVQNGWLLMHTGPAQTGRFFANGFANDSLSVWDMDNNLALQPELKGSLKNINIEVRSAGSSDGNLADFLLNGLNAFSSKRGHNVVVLDPENGSVLAARDFDTWEYSSQADSLAAFIRGLAPGAIALAAIRDEGMRKMNEAAYTALESLGSAMIRNVQVGESWALIGRKGAAPGSVPEAYSPLHNGPAVVSKSMFFLKGGSSYGVLFSNSTPSKDFLLFDSRAAQVPHLVLDKPGYLRTGANGADYIIITHPNFLSQAQRLAQHRERMDHLRTRVVLIEDIYDEFNAGLQDPRSVKDFLKYCFDQWPRPAPQYVVLFGDASWDPKKNLYDATAKDFVPTYGNPVSDTWFVCLDGDEDLVPDMDVGRLPVSTPEEAQAVVDKIIAYETTPSAEWKKTFLFISGGFDEVEQPIFDRQSQYLADKFVSTAPVCGKVLLINKTSTGLEEGEHREDILQALDTGTVWTNFVGHAGSRTWDLMFHNPDIDALDNSPHYPFISSMTCHTGRFAEPNQVSFGEHFVNVAEKGAIAFWGTSGWGYVAEDFLFLQKLYPIALQDTVHHIGTAITCAKIGMWETFGSNAHIRNLTYQYTLLGDPAMDLALPKVPDLTFLPNDMSVDPLVPSEADSIATVRVKVRNFGLKTAPQDSVQIALFVNHPQRGRIPVATVQTLSSVALLDSVVFQWPLRDMAGSVELEAVLDPNEHIRESDETNNSLKMQVTVLSGRLQLESPLNCQMLPADPMELVIQNPREVVSSELAFEFQMDTTFEFNSPYVQSSGPIPSGILTTRWKPSSVVPGTVYFWRCRNYSEQVQTAWSSASFRAGAESEYGWRQSHEKQFGLCEKNEVDVRPKGVQLYPVPVSLYAESAGYADGDFARIVVNGQPVLKPERGHNVAIVDPGTGTVEYKGSFDTYLNTAAADAMAELINSVDPGKYILIGIRDEGTVSMTENAYAALESIGSQYCRQVKARDSWAIIGIKGATAAQVKETLVSSGHGSAVAMDTLYYFQKKGQLISPPIGPTGHWKSLKWAADVPEFCGMNVGVLGYNNATGKTDTLLQNLTDAGGVDLSSISAGTYPYLAVISTLSTKNGRYSPVLREWQVTFDPVSDLAIGPKVFTISQDSVLVGGHVLIDLKLYNIGQSVNDTVTVRFQESDAEAGRRTFAEHKAGPIPVNGFAAIQQSWFSAGKSGMIQIFVSVNPDKAIPELSYSNNTYSSHVFVRKDSTGPQIKVTFDGREMLNDDLAASQPKILLEIRDNSPQPISDTTSVNIFLDSKRISFAGAVLKFKPASGPDIKGLVEYTPILTNGDHVLDMYVSDASKNMSTYHLEFRVIKGLKILNVMNYPNPFSKDTAFTFELSQSARVELKIFTIAGRLVRVLECGWLSAGFNSAPWDGHDADGDELANGVYLYKISAEQDGEQTEEMGKSIVMK